MKSASARPDLNAESLSQERENASSGEVQFCPNRDTPTPKTRHFPRSRPLAISSRACYKMVDPGRSTGMIVRTADINAPARLRGTAHRGSASGVVDGH